MNKIIVANWKMNPSTLAEAKALFNSTITQAQQYPNVTTVVCPPFVYLEELAKQRQETSDKRQVELGAQDVFWEESGAFTGEISTTQLAEFGVSYVLVGHSERRALGETDEIINKKLLAVLQRGLTPILLVGEKEKGDYREDILIDQLSRDLAGVKSKEVGKILVTYEPVWAISSHSGGVSDTPESALTAMGTIAKVLQKMFPGQDIRPMLYGGSVNSSNIGDFLKYPEIAGAVVGSASLKKEEITAILEMASKNN